MAFWDFDCPYIQQVFEYTDTTLVFDGYFRIESKTCPVRRIMTSGDRYLWIEILTKEELEDTSGEGFYDEELGGRIILTPTAKIKITYRVIKEIESEDELMSFAAEREASKEAEKECNAAHRREREEAEWKAQMEHAKTIDYSKWLKKSEDKPE